MAFTTYFMNIANPYIKINQKPNSADLYKLFYDNIQQSQIRNKKHLDIFTNLIEQEVRRINVVTDDPVEQNIIRENTTLLMKLDKDIRDIYVAEQAGFLDALRTVFKFQGPDVR